MDKNINNLNGMPASEPEADKLPVIRNLPSFASESYPPLPPDTLASHISAKASIGTFRNNKPTPILDKAYIVAMSKAPVNDADADRVRNHHSNIFMTAHERFINPVRHNAAFIGSALAARLRNIAAESKTLMSTPRYTETIVAGEQWTWFDRLKFAALIAFALLFQGVEVVNVATTLFATGLPVFEEHPYTVWCMASFVLIGTLGVKAFMDFITSAENRRRTAMILLGLGVVMMGFWFVYYATTYPNIAQSSANVLDQLSLSKSGVTEGHKLDASPMLTIFGLFALTFLAAGLWMDAEYMYKSRARHTRVENQAYTKAQANLAILQYVQQYDTDTLGALRGVINEVEREHDTFVERAVGMYKMLAP